MKTKLHYLFIALFFGVAAMNAQTGTVWLTGTGVGGWAMEGKLKLETTDNITFTKTNFQIIGNGEMKFTDGTAWTQAAGPDGLPTNPGFPTGNATDFTDQSNNIVGTPGWWSVTYDFSTKAYTFTPGVNPNRNVSLDGTAITGGTLVLTSSDGINYAKGSVVVANGTGQFVEKVSDITPTPTANWSSVGFPTGTGTQGGAMIPVAEGVYDIGFNITNGSYFFDPIIMCPIGGFNGWNDLPAAPADPSMYEMTTVDNINFEITVTFSGSNIIRFRDAHNWNTEFGGPSFPSGTLIPGGGNNISHPAGVYLIKINRLTLAYEFISQNPNINYTGTTSSPALKALATADGVNYAGEELTFSAAGAGTFNEVASAGNPGPTFGSWPAVVSPAAGFWNVLFNKTTGVSSFVPTVVGLIGDFTASGWGTDVNFTSVDGINYTLNNVVFDLAGCRNFKIRDNHSWSVQFGGAADLVSPDVTPLSGTLVDTNAKDMWLNPGTYNFTFNRVTFAYTITPVLAVNKFETIKFSVYPNPTNNSWNFASANGDISSVRIVDMLGKTVMSKKASSTEVSVDASSLSKGMYFAEIVAGEAVQTLKVMKN